jgi:hypothetical protein
MLIILGIIALIGFLGIIGLIIAGAITLPIAFLSARSRHKTRTTAEAIIAHGQIFNLRETQRILDALAVDAPKDVEANHLWQKLTELKEAYIKTMPSALKEARKPDRVIQAIWIILALVFFIGIPLVIYAMLNYKP